MQATSDGLINKSKRIGEKQKRRLQALESFAKSQTVVVHDAAASSTPISTIGQDMAGMLAADSPIMGLSGMMQHQDLGSAPSTSMGSFIACGSSFNAAALNYQTSGPAPMYRYTPNIDYQVDDELNPGRSFREDLFSTPTPLVTQAGSEAITPGSGFDSPCMQQAASQSHSINILHSQSPGRDEADTLLAQFLLQDDIPLSKTLLRDIRKNKITLKDVLRKGLQSLERDSCSSTGSLKVADSSLQGRTQCKSMQGEFEGATITPCSNIG